MSILKDLQRNFKSHHLIALLGVVILVAALTQYSGRKGSVNEGNTSNAPSPHQSPLEDEATLTPHKLAEMNKKQRDQLYGTESGDNLGGAQYGPAAPAGQNEVFASAAGITTGGGGLPPSCSRVAVSNPAALLPKDTNSEFARLNPRGADDLANVNLLQAGYHAGINTVGGSLRNANLQVRSEPPNPTSRVSPWMNSTIEPDLMRVPLELGCGSQ